MPTYTIKSSGGDYTNLQAAETGQQGTLSAVITFECHSLEDTTWTIDGSTTTSSNYFEIIAAQNHGGKWSTSSYRVKATVFGNVVATVADQYTRIIGLQFDNTGGSGTGTICLRVSSGGNNTVIRKCIARASAGTGIQIEVSSCELVDSLVYDSAGSQVLWYGVHPAVFENCTLIGGAHGVDNFYAGNSLPCKNILLSGSSGACFYSTSANTFAPTYCASSDGTADDWGGTGNRVTQTFTFVDATNKDYKLDTGDTGAKDLGTAPTYTDDLAGVTWASPYDIGALSVTSGGGGGVVLYTMMLMGT
jgi:hypothetical protein